jgi:hypothetical protein
MDHEQVSLTDLSLPQLILLHPHEPGLAGSGSGDETGENRIMD